MARKKYTFNLETDHPEYLKLKNLFDNMIVIPRHSNININEFGCEKSIKLKTDCDSIILKAENDMISFENVPIGRYKLSCSKGKRNVKYIYVIYDALSEDPEVNISVERLEKAACDKKILRKYHFINDQKIYDGYVDQPESFVYAESNDERNVISWKHNQFSFIILDYVMDLVNKIPLKKRTIINIIKEISSFEIIKKCHGCDLEKVLQCNDSLEIIKEFMKNRKPTLFGESWTFACLNISLLRSIGIPCRLLSYFASDDEMEYIMSSLKERESIPTEVVNEFHTWTEFWSNGSWLPYVFEKIYVYEADGINSKVVLEFDCRTWSCD